LQIDYCATESALNLISSHKSRFEVLALGSQIHRAQESLDLTFLMPAEGGAKSGLGRWSRRVFPRFPGLSWLMQVLTTGARVCNSAICVCLRVKSTVASSWQSWSCEDRTFRSRASGIQVMIAACVSTIYLTANWKLKVSLGKINRRGVRKCGKWSKKLGSWSRKIIKMHNTLRHFITSDI